MTENERMVWAATYAAELSRLVLAPQRYCDDDGGMRAVATAVENASAAVTWLRESREAVAEGFGENGPEYQRLLEMGEPA